jgi:acetoin utilization deacetylase AcuC-like enzyme
MFSNAHPICRSNQMRLIKLLETRMLDERTIKGSFATMHSKLQDTQGQLSRIHDNEYWTLLKGSCPRPRYQVILDCPGQAGPARLQSLLALYLRRQRVDASSKLVAQREVKRQSPELAAMLDDGYSSIGFCMQRFRESDQRYIQ